MVLVVEPVMVFVGQAMATPSESGESAVGNISQLAGSAAVKLGGMFSEDTFVIVMLLNWMNPGEVCGPIGVEVKIGVTIGVELMVPVARTDGDEDDSALDIEEVVVSLVDAAVDVVVDAVYVKSWAFAVNPANIPPNAMTAGRSIRCFFMVLGFFHLISFYYDLWFQSLNFVGRRRHLLRRTATVIATALCRKILHNRKARNRVGLRAWGALLFVYAFRVCEDRAEGGKRAS